MDKVLSAKVTHRDYFNVKNICKEFRINKSEFIRNAIYFELDRLRNLSKEERIQEISDNVIWNCSKHEMSESGKVRK